MKGVLTQHKYIDNRQATHQLIIWQILNDTEQWHRQMVLLTQFNTCNSQRPDVHFAIILALIHRQYHLRSHPVRRPNKRVSRTDSWCGAKVSCNQYHILLCVGKHVSPLWCNKGLDLTTELESFTAGSEFVECCCWSKQFYLSSNMSTNQCQTVETRQSLN